MTFKLMEKERCGGLKMAPHVNKWSPLGGAHKSQVTVIVTTSELSLFTYLYISVCNLVSVD